MINHVFISFSTVQICDITSYQSLVFFPIYGYIMNSQLSDQLPDGLIAQLVEHCTGIAEVMGLRIPFRSEFFFQALISQLLKLCVYTVMINHVFILIDFVQNVYELQTYRTAFSGLLVSGYITQRVQTLSFHVRPIPSWRRTTTSRRLRLCLRQR